MNRLFIRAEITQAFFDLSVVVPDGYDRAGIAVGDHGPVLFVTAEGLPPMYWSGPEKGWEAVLPPDPLTN